MYVPVNCQEFNIVFFILKKKPESFSSCSKSIHTLNKGPSFPFSWNTMQQWPHIKEQKQTERDNLAPLNPFTLKLNMENYGPFKGGHQLKNTPSENLC